jgi:hypothetical protein
MKSVLKKTATLVAIVLMATIFTAKASAECATFAPPKAGASLQPQSWQEELFQQASLLLVSDHDQDSIVGMWKATFTAQGNPGQLPPDGAVIDSAFVQWHSDGTEIMNSGRPAQDGNICLGVWERTGRSRYKLNHFALGNDTSNAPTGIGNPAGPARILEDVTLSRDGNHYAGTFVLDAYDPAGNHVAHIVGQITATRITVNTPVSSVL